MSVMFLVFSALAAAGTGWRVEDLGTLGGRSSAASAVNERGQVVGISSTAGPEQHAFFWEAGVMRDLGTLGGRHSFAWDINERGDVVGGAQDAEGRTRAVRWRGGQIESLGTLPGGEASFALAINDRGQVAGFSRSGDGETHAVLWDGGEVIDLGTLGGGFSYALDVNSRGDVLAMSATEDGHRAFLWRDGRRVDVGPPAVWSSGLDLNDAGQVVGSAPVPEGDRLVGYRWSPDGTVETFGLGGELVVVTAINEAGACAGHATLPATVPAGLEASRDGGPRASIRLAQALEPAPPRLHAFVYRAGEILDLGTLGGRHSSAIDINRRGQVVGAAARADGVPRAFVWGDGKMSELPTPPDASAGASDINDLGQVVGSWSAPDGQRRAFLAVPCAPGAPCGPDGAEVPSTR
jgi:probable HAF family extracellular repeat protein